MEVLNTITGEVGREITGWGIVVLLAIFAGFLIMIAGSNEREMFFGLILILVAILLGAIFGMNKDSDAKPTRYEVKINDPNYVIDATKYRYIEKRGEIVILEEVKQ